MSAGGGSGSDEDAAGTGPAEGPGSGPRSGESTPSAGARVWARGGYLLLLALVLLSPLSFRLDGGFLAERVGDFLSPGALTPGDAVDAVRNVLLLAGWGLLEVVTDAGRSRRQRVIAGLLGGAAVGMTAEVAQLALPARVPSLLDAAMNAAGAGLGALAADVAQRAVAERRGRPASLGVPAAALAAPYVLAVLIEAGIPALRNAGTGPGAGGPLARASWAIEHFSLESAAVVPLLDAALFLPAGVLLAAAFLEAGRAPGRAFRLSAAWGAAVALVGELAHAPLGIPLEVGPVLVHAGAWGLGGWIGARALPGWLEGRGSHGTDPARGFLWAYAALLALWRLRPFVPELDPGAIAAELAPSRWSPLSALGARQELYSVADVLRSFLLFLPVGAALAAGERTGSGRSGGPDGSPRRALGWILCLALFLEGGQALVAGRFFDGTDLVIMAAGGAVAWSVVRRHPSVPDQGRSS